jgi:catechol 1,2-dioxygenase
MYGRVTCGRTKKTLANAYVDVWEASTNGINSKRNGVADLLISPGLYEQQDPDQKDCNLRGKFKTDENGEYAFYCLRPTPYPVPDDGPAGKLLKLMDRHPFRPAHIHLIVRRKLSWILVRC